MNHYSSFGAICQVWNDGLYVGDTVAQFESGDSFPYQWTIVQSLELIFGKGVSIESGSQLIFHLPHDSSGGSPYYPHDSSDGSHYYGYVYRSKNGELHVITTTDIDEHAVYVEHIIDDIYTNDTEIREDIARMCKL